MSPDPLTMDVLHSTEELEFLAPEWWHLWRDTPNATPFQSPAWLIPWWKQIGQGELCALAFRRDRALVGLLPLHIFRDPQNGERRLLLLGAGTSDYLDGLFPPPHETLCLERVCEFLSSGSPLWDRVQFTQLREESPLLKFLRHAPGAQVVSSETCFVFRVGNTSDLPKQLRSNLRHYGLRAVRAGRVRYTVAPAESVVETLETLAKLHQKRWRRRGSEGMLADEDVFRHHQESVPLLAKAGLLRLFTLSLSDQVIAALYAFVDAPNRPHRTLFYYLSGFDPAYRNLSPGTLLLSFATETARTERVEYVDMLRGGESYKRFWGAVPQPTYGIHMSAPAQARVASAL